MIFIAGQSVYLESLEPIGGNSWLTFGPFIGGLDDGQPYAVEFANVPANAITDPRPGQLGRPITDPRPGFEGRIVTDPRN